MKNDISNYNVQIMDRLSTIERTHKDLIDEMKPLKDKILSLEQQKANVLNSISETHKLKNFEDFLESAEN